MTVTLAFNTPTAQLTAPDGTGNVTTLPVPVGAKPPSYTPRLFAVRAVLVALLNLCVIEMPDVTGSVVVSSTVIRNAVQPAGSCCHALSTPAVVPPPTIQCQFASFQLNAVVWSVPQLVVGPGIEIVAGGGSTAGGVGCGPESQWQN